MLINAFGTMERWPWRLVPRASTRWPPRLLSCWSRGSPPLVGKRRCSYAQGAGGYGDAHRHVALQEGVITDLFSPDLPQLSSAGC